ncbi:hypothetical protein PoB_004824400 [Plakobranchus ocellatus]|uniref:Uncharacterized protein n=1 Tax=Plakobranchus ocellatus TaxID=259542 RepID=A0AAV4BNQ3_9GAST|nr:hypothetical protein PoB_004824400 [Plakobranchus ocellatus]
MLMMKIIINFDKGDADVDDDYDDDDDDNDDDDDDDDDDDENREADETIMTVMMEVTMTMIKVLVNEYGIEVAKSGMPRASYYVVTDGCVKRKR